MCADRKAAPGILGKVMVLGLGTTGRAVCDYLLTQQERLEVFCVYAGASSEDARAFAATLEAAGAQVFFDTIEVSGSFDLCIASPGISQFSDFYQNAAAHAKEVISEVEFAWRESAAIQPGSPSPARMARPPLPRFARICCAAEVGARRQWATSATPVSKR